ncbi:MAG: serine/threonine-protein kinase [Planctomycetia bacterium]|nr:serine/threonine-protein kinase [Planctomycetia bacterium]
MGPGELESGVTIGDFRIERRLGAGGMGVVYLAKQLSLQRSVALKVLGPALEQGEYIARFRREAQAAARLMHAGIAQVYFVGQDEQACFMAMEFVDGVTLRHVINRMIAASDAPDTIDEAAQQPEAARALAIRFDWDASTEVEQVEDSANPFFSGKRHTPKTLKDTKLSGLHVRRASELVREAALALEHAHDHGVIHRDVKPDNIMVDRAGHIRIVDFGVARFFDDRSLTLTGQLVGTPMYMSPEQVTGRLDLDQRTDVYSLGLVLYELLALANPIVAPSREGVLRQIVAKPLLPVSWKNRTVPRGLEAIVHKATAKDPDDRYQRAADLAADLHRFLAAQPVVAEPYRYRYDPRDILAKRPNAVLAAASILFAAALCMIALMAPGQIFVTLAVELPGQPAPDRNVVWLTTAAIVATGAIVGALGWGVLMGRNIARWLAIGLCAIYGFVMSWMAITLLHFADDTKELELTAQSFLLATILLPTILLAVTALALLFTRPAREWFRLARQSRREYKAMRNATRQ